MINCYSIIFPSSPCFTSTEDIKGEKVESYRDTTGIQSTDFAKVLALVDRTTPKGKRDYAILRLLWDNALRRSEVCNLNVGDFNAQSSTLSILGKGKGTQKVVVDLSRKTVEAIADWLIASKGASKLKQPLFTVIAYNGNGKRLTGEAIRRLVDGLCKKVGITKQIKRTALGTVRLLLCWIKIMVITAPRKGLAVMLNRIR
ncbi:tyrosine-type recombinase/integrase [Tolypothrix sp. NIES-4075]|uniref:tyrosine-type recombinase/integrase n=1 Tax=Tolypothrix sp. NIES-4075 TaxID=2005459 RepID=UPI001F1D3604|nr:tyrosine-type recombinase/integrase [Tolypothrix sp. NIES-4075]